MGFFTTNEHSNLYRSYEFPVVEGYSGTIGCGLAIVEGYQNDLALFSAVVESDLNEMAIVNEGAGDSEVCALMESTISNMIDALKKFFIKLGAKIKAIFTGFMAKLESYFTKDLKAYVKKYEKSLDRKDFKDMKVKIEPIKGNDYTVPDVIKPEKYSIDDTAGTIDYTTGDDVVNKKYEDWDREDAIKVAYNAIADNSVDNNSDFDDWYHDKLFDTEETKDDWDFAKVKAVANRLTNNTKTLKDIKTLYDKIQGDIKKYLKVLDDEDKRLGKLWKDSNDGQSGGVGMKFVATVTRTKDNRKGSGQINHAYTANADGDTDKQSLNAATKQIQIMRQNASAYQEVILHISQVVMKEAKYAIAQDKKVFAKAVAYKTITDEATMLDMIAECAFDETIEDLNRSVA